MQVNWLDTCVLTMMLAQPVACLEVLPRILHSNCVVIREASSSKSVTMYWVLSPFLDASTMTGGRIRNARAHSPTAHQLSGTCLPCELDDRGCSDEGRRSCSCFHNVGCFGHCRCSLSARRNCPLGIRICILLGR